MKTPRFQISIVMAAAIGTIVLTVSSTHAGPLKGFGRLRSPERDATSLASSNLETGKVHHPAPPVPLPPGYPRYRLIDLGTLGGPNASVWGIALQLNNHGKVIAQLGTAVPDPYNPNCLADDCFIWHGVVGETNGTITDLGALPGVNHSVPVCITESGLIAGFSQNSLIDPLTGFPQVRAVLWNRDHTIVELGTLGGNSSQGFAVNDRGQIVGVALNDTPENPDFAGFMNDLGGVLPAAQQVRAFLCQNGSMQDLGTLGGNDASATMINHRGQIAVRGGNDSYIYRNLFSAANSTNSAFL